MNNLIDDKYLFSDLDEIELLRTVLIGRQLAGTSLVVDEYERALSEFFGVKRAVALSSGSAAIHAALYAVGVERGSEVLIPATAPLVSALPILTAGATPIIVDSEPSGLDFDPVELTKKISVRTKAALIVPLWGYPIDIERSMRILSDHGIPLVEDACQAHGTVVNGRFAGTLGKIGCFSTHDRKLLATGEGGFVLTNDESAAVLIKEFSRLGYLKGEKHGVNYKLNAISAALGRSRLRALPRQLELRKQNAMLLLATLKDTLLTELFYSPTCFPNYYTVVMICGGPIQNVQSIKRRFEDLGLLLDSTRYKYMPLSRRDLFSGTGVECPNASDFAERTIQVPVHPGLSAEQIQSIGEALRVALAK